jgi:tetratricopeptide (TPR) repeat protein
MLDLIEHIADWSRDTPIFLLCMARPELLDDRPNWGGGKLNATSILLEPLAATDSQKLMRHLLGDANLSDEVQERITSAAEGNPLFVEEMLAMLVDDGLLQWDGGQWVAVGDVSEVNVPPTVQSLIAARLDRLEPDERSVIERGSVEGKLFHMGSLTALAPEDERATIPDRIMSLVRKELIRPDRSELIGDEAFRFRHLLIRDAAYDSMSKKTRADLHQRFAEWLADHVEHAPGGVDAVLAYHFDQAYQYRVELGNEGEPERRLAELAGSRYMTAAEAALAHGDYTGARGQLDRASNLLDPTSDAGLQVKLQLSRTLVLIGEYERADTMFSDIERLAQASGNRHLELKAGVGLLSVRDRLETEWPDELFISTSENLENALSDLGDHKSALEALMLRLNWLPRSEGIALSERAVEMAHKLGATELESDASWWLLAVSFWGATPASEGVELARSMLEEQVTNLEHKATQLLMLGGFLEMLGRVDEGQVETERGLTMFQELGLNAESVTAFTQGWISMLTGDLDRADRVLRAGYSHHAEKGEKNRLSSMAAGIAHVAALHDETDEALEFISIAEKAAVPDDVDTHGEVAITRTIMALRDGDASEAIQRARHALDITERRGSPWAQAGFLLVLADALEEVGDRVRAVESLEEALSRFEQKEFLKAAEQTRARLNELSR